MIMVAMTLSLTHCMKPYQEDIYVNVGPNETAYVIPLEGANRTTQRQFRSISYLDSNKVAAKRIHIPTHWHKEGRLPRSGEFILDALVLKVDRAPVTREWTKDKDNGTSKQDQEIVVESAESIGFGLGVTITAYVEEPNTSRFLYYYSGKDLNYVIDKNIRSFVQSELGKAFASGPLADVVKKKGEIFDQVYQKAKAKFVDKGVTIENIGVAGELHFLNPDVQSSINATFASEKERETAANKAEAAKELLAAKQAVMFQTEMKIKEMKAQADINRSTRWDGKLPEKMIPSGAGSAFLFSGE